MGNAPVTQADLLATNGVVHIMGGVPSQMSILNESSVTVASNIGNFGPYNLSQARAAECTSLDCHLAASGRAVIGLTKKIPLLPHFLPICHDEFMP